jgi:glutamate-1-semialdehyde aminotransferase
MAARWWVSQTLFTHKVEFAELKSELQLLEKTDYATLKSENERLEAELDKMRAQMREEVSRMQSGVRLDMNLEKGRLRDEALVQDSKIKETEARIELEIAGVRTQMQALKFDMLKLIFGTHP